jgi:integrase
LGSWGRVTTSPWIRDSKGKTIKWRARAYYREFSGATIEVMAAGRTRAGAENRVLVKLRERASARHGATLTSTDRFSKAAELWYEQLTAKVADGRRAASTQDTYRRELDIHILPALGEVRLGEVTTALVDSVLQSIKTRVGAPTAKSTRSVVSGVLSLAARHGAIATNPVRDADSIPAAPKRRPRALEETERREWFDLLDSDPKATQADLPDLCRFLLATGCRIGEALGLKWSEVDLGRGEIEINAQVIRIKGEGLVRGPTKSAAGERRLVLPGWCVDMLKQRAIGANGDQDPVFCDALGGFRDPSNVRRDLRRARAPKGNQARRELGEVLARARRRLGSSRGDVAARLGWKRTRLELLETGRVRTEIDEVTVLADLYAIRGLARTELLTLAEEAVKASDADALSWITSHTFRKTNATILDDAGLSARQIADQLGHARPSLTQDVYMGRKAKNRAAAAALEDADGRRGMEPKPETFPDTSRARRDGAGL